jgi:ATP-dependent helicase HrpB
MLVEGARLGALGRAALAAAMLAERDPFRAPASGGRPSEAHHTSDSDVLDRVAVLEGSASGGEVLSAGGRLNRHAARQVTRAAEQLERLAKAEAADSSQRKTPPDEALLRALLAAYPDRVARRREPGGRRFVLVGGRGAKLADESAVDQAELIVAVDVQEIGRSESLIRLASTIQREWLPAERLSTMIDVEFDPRRQRVVALRRVRYGDLVLREDPTALPPEVDPGPVLAKAAAELIGEGWQLGESDQTFLARVDLLRRALPELSFPDLGEYPLRDCLDELCAGRQSLDELRSVALAPIWMNRLTSEQRRAIDREAPLRVQVPSGRALPLDYAIGKPPVLAVRIQELFGLRSGPRVAAGRVPVLLHLLGPNYRPQQVTDDLESFWTNTYPQVRKDLRRRYPKHAWPEDPWTAKPESRPQRKQR